MRTGEKITMYCASDCGGALECNGQAVSRTIFNNLYDLIGTDFGSGDGSTTFNLPDEQPYPTGCKVYIGI